MIRVIVLVTMLLVVPASAQSVEPGTVVMMASAAPQPGSYEAHPAIILKDGSTCDLMSLICVARAEDDFGPTIYAKRDEIIRKLVESYRAMK